MNKLPLYLILIFLTLACGLGGVLPERPESVVLRYVDACAINDIAAINATGDNLPTALTLVEEVNGDTFVEFSDLQTERVYSDTNIIVIQVKGKVKVTDIDLTNLPVDVPLITKNFEIKLPFKKNVQLRLTDGQWKITKVE